MTMIRLRRGTAASWATADPVLQSGEPGYATDTGVFKIGNGADSWTELQVGYGRGGFPESGGTDATAVFAASMLEAAGAVRTDESGDGYADWGTKVIDIPAGDWFITDLHALLGDEGMSTKAWNLRFRGQGTGITNVIFDSAVVGALCRNSWWMDVQFENINFICTSAAAGSTFLESYQSGSSSATHYTFTKCMWTGPWKYIIDLQGADNNDTWRFIGCTDTGMAANGAFLHVGSSTTSDQFLQFWFLGHVHISTAASFVDMAKGGHVHIYGLDVSDYALGATAPAPLFALRGNNHSLGVCEFYAEGVRVEAKDAEAKIFMCEWQHGNVTFQNLDLSSQRTGYTYGADVIDIRYGQVSGPTYTFRDSYVVGGLKVTINANDWQHSHRIKFENCHIAPALTPSEFVTYDASTTGGQTVYPPIEFVGCRGDERNAGSGGNGLSVWDATYSGTGGELGVPKRLRQFHCRSAFGSPYGAGTLKYNLPIGALITGIRAVAPAGGTAEADGGTWTLKTTEGTPTTISSVTVAGALSAGFNQADNLAVPFLCDTRAKATVTVTCTNVAAVVTTGFLIIEGYW